MQRIPFLLILAACAVLPVPGAWYWPFGGGEDDPSKPVRLHRLLEEANNYIEIAEDEALDGNADKALENYRLALAELDRVERENPGRAETAEFSPLRNKRAACVAAMDAIRFAQVNDNERAVSVTDTRELQKKWNRKHGIKEPEEKTSPAKQEAPKLAAGEEPAETPTAAKTETPKPAVVAKPDSKPVAVKAEAPRPPVKESPPSADFTVRFKTALAEVRNRDYAAADLMLEALLKERPNDLNALLLRAAAQAGLDSNYAARRTLERAMRAHPRSYLPYYNLANLVLKLGEGVESARQYYEMGRTVGGPALPALEARLKGGK